MQLEALVAHISEWLGAISVAWLFSLSPRLQKPPIGFKYARREGFIALSLYALLLVFGFFFYTVNPPQLRDLPIPVPVEQLPQALVVAGLGLLAFIIAMIVRRQPPKAIGWNPALITPALQMGLAIGILTIFLRNRVMDVLANINGENLTILLMGLGIALAEETIFRGFIQMRLGWWLGKWQGLVITAAMFAIWQALPWFRWIPLESLLISTGLTFAQGLVLGWVMNKSGSVAAPALYRAISIWMKVIA